MTRFTCARCALGHDIDHNPLCPRSRAPPAYASDHDHSHLAARRFPLFGVGPAYPPRAFADLRIQVASALVIFLMLALVQLRVLYDLVERVGRLDRRRA